MSDRWAYATGLYLLFGLPIGAAIGLHGWVGGVVLAALVAVGVLLIWKLADIPHKEK